MTIIEKLKLEENNFLSVRVYGNKGVFANAYERSAYAIHKLFGTKPNVHFNSKLNTYYISVGIVNKQAKEKLESKFKELDVTNSDEGHTLYMANFSTAMFNEEDFQVWKGIQIANSQVWKEKNKIATPSPKTNKQKTDIVSDSNETDTKIQERLAFCESILTDILEQQLANYTPMDAIIYLSNLQSKIRDERV